MEVAKVIAEDVPLPAVLAGTRLAHCGLRRTIRLPVAGCQTRGELKGVVWLSGARKAGPSALVGVTGSARVGVWLFEGRISPPRRVAPSAETTAGLGHGAATCLRMRGKEIGR